MTLHVHALSPNNPTDALYFPAIARIHLAAWLTVPVTRAIYYGSEEVYPAYRASMEERGRKAFLEDPECRYAVVLDDALPSDPELEDGSKVGDGGERTEKGPKGKLIAAIKYYFVEAPKPAATASSGTAPATTHEPRAWPPHSNALLADDYVAHLMHARDVLTAKIGAHVLIDNLYTDPNHHRRGAGSMLMRHACAEADAQRLPCVLEASPKGLGVYESVGFRRVGEGGTDGKGSIWVDLQRWEGGVDSGVLRTRSGEGDAIEDGWYVQVLMTRPAREGDDDGVEK